MAALCLALPALVYGQGARSFRVDGFRFYFFSNERNEPPHVHLRKGNGKGKFWIAPVALAWARGLQPGELSRAREIVIENRGFLLEAWHGHFGTTP